jgi:hypothetical protein
MPLEIRELVIRTSVTSESSRSEIDDARDGSLSEAERDSIIAACIDQILAILQSRSER